MNLDDENRHTLSPPPEWLKVLEERQKLHHRLAHEIGSGAPCNACGDKCCGLDLHFWRKICKNCKCSKESHDVKDESVDVHFEIIFGHKPAPKPEKFRLKTKSDSHPKTDYSNEHLAITGNVQLDWCPPDTSSEVVEKYLATLPTNQLPITGTPGAQHRINQLKKQIPLHDLDPKFCHDMSKDELRKLEEYSLHTRNHVVGQALVVIAPFMATALSETVIAENPKFTGSVSSLRREPKNPVPTFAADITTCQDNLSNLNLLESGNNNQQNIIKDLLLTNEVLSNKSYEDYTCNDCNNEIMPGEVAVWVKRDKSNLYWHPQCFICTECQEPLADLIYFLKNKKVFCGRHYPNACNLVRCAACDELIFSPEYTLTEGKNYHVEHFCCFECDKYLADQQYVLKSEHPVCLDCYHEKYGKTCLTCNKKISIRDQAIGLDTCNWHATPECFHCWHCKKSMVGLKFHLTSTKKVCCAAHAGLAPKFGSSELSFKGET